MPELPEVETVKNELLPYITGRCVTGVTLFWEGIVRQPSAREFCSRLIGQTITGIARRGKYLIVGLNSEDLLIIHLKMTGSLLIGQDSSEPPRFTRAIIRLDKNENSIIGKLGPEPLTAEFTHQVLTQRLAKRTAPIKALLCDQGFIAGIGNMYADEALFAAKIHPLRSGESLSQKEVERLHSAIQQILWSAISNKGASVANYFRPDGTLGTAHFEFKVAHGIGKTCPHCGTPIERIVVRNRGTYFCPKCQAI